MAPVGTAELLAATPWMALVSPPPLTVVAGVAGKPVATAELAPVVAVPGAIRGCGVTPSDARCW